MPSRPKNRFSFASLGRLAAWLAAAVAVGVLWAWAETVIHRGLFPTGFFYNRSFAVAVANRAVFYGVASGALWALFAAAGAVFRRLRRREIRFANVAGRALAGVAAVAAWVNLNLVALFLLFEVIGVPARTGFLFPALASLPTLAVVVAVLWLLARLQRRSLTIRRVLQIGGRLILAGAFTAGVTLHVVRFLHAANRPMPAALPDVVVITLDAWRADGLNDNYAPSLVAFGREDGVILTNAYAPSSCTLQSFAGMFTGAYNVTQCNSFEYKENLKPTWAEVMWENGYDTYAVVCNPYLDTARILFRGFASYDFVEFRPLLRTLHFYDTAWYFAVRGQTFDREEPGRTSRLLSGKALAVLRNPSRRPKFVWIHYIDPHYPYQPADDLLAQEAPDLVGVREYGYNRAKLGAENAEIIKALYDYEIKTTDGYAAEILAELRTRPNTLVIISSDHGEEFFEHGCYEHRKNLYGETTRVPLIIAMPGGDDTPLRTLDRGGLFSLIDLAPSVLTYLGFEAPPTMEGERGLLAGAVSADRAVFTALRRKDQKFYAALIHNDRKTILNVAGGKTSYEYYDLLTGPGEREALAWDERGEEMKRRLEAWVHARVDLREEGVPESKLFEQREDLKALGYL
ncbi:MAG: sulfatase [Candidatus Coatesbacteria bacterium]|nr:MAG: sulfatase [Candidatus Coatesbacteria bacterium]